MATTEVKKGDSLSKIADRLGISLSALIKLNPQINNPSLINPGQIINIPEPTPAAVNKPTVDLSARGATAPGGLSGKDVQLAEAAKAYALSPAGIRAANDAYVPPTSEVDNFQASIDEAAGMDSSSYAIDADGERTDITNLDFSSLTPEEQAALGNIGESSVVSGSGKTAVSTYVDPATGDTYALYSDGTRELLSKGTRVADEASAAAKETLTAEREAALAEEEKKTAGKSAYDLLFLEFDRNGLGALVEPLKKFIEEGLSPAEFTLRLRETDAYKKRFAANTIRVAKGLRALSEAEYIGTEDQYQDVMRRYGMPESYYAKGDLGVQTGFEKFLAADVSAVELEDRIQTAQNRVINSNPEVTRALKEFYPGISNGDILSYVLDPANAIEQIKRKVTAAEIGGAAIQSGLKAGMTRAEELAAAGITKQQAQTGFQTIAEVAPRGGVLAEIYKQDPYTQTTAEQEVFGLAGSVDAAKQRKKLTQLETAAFSGSAGMGAIARDRAGAF
jgi:LysM repeat protein